METTQGPIGQRGFGDGFGVGGHRGTLGKGVMSAC